MTSTRKRLGAWYTPPALVAAIVDAVLTPEFVHTRSDRGRPVRVLDPACGDGRFLAAVRQRVMQLGGECELVGVDVDLGAVGAALAAVPDASIVHADALTHDFGDRRYDLVIGNPPFLSQMAAATTRGGASLRSGGPYADAAVEFLALASELAEPDGGRVAFVLPQSILAARDAGALRADIDARAALVWSWWTGERVFDAQVLTVALAFEFGGGDAAPRRERGNWSHVVTSRRAVPPVPALAVDGTLGDRATLNANFRDEYYGMVPAVGDHPAGPPLITSGLIDPGRSRWGERPVTFAKRRFARPRLDVALLDPAMQRWADKRLVPKVLVANQTSIVEAVCDEHGAWLPAVPVVAIYPTDLSPGAAWPIAAVLTSPVASAWAWHRSAGTGLSSNTIRLGPVLLADLPWPAGDLSTAVARLRDEDVVGCGQAVSEAFGLGAHPAEPLFSWWRTAVERIDRRAAAGA